MSYATQSQTNITVGPDLLERVMLSTLTTVPCCVFLFINGIMLFTLRSKTVFRETPRYILLFNLLLAETMQMALGQLLYLLAASRIRLTYPVCGVLIMFSSLTTSVSPVTLVVMSLERYVAVCYPLRHSAIITIRNTAVAIIVVWAFSSLNVLTRVLLLLDFPFEDLESLQMKEFCAKETMFLDPTSHEYDKVNTYILFISASVAIVCSYIGVMIAARSASTSKASALKARNTLLLHLVQLGLSLVSTMHNAFIVAFSAIATRTALVRIHIFLYVFIVLLPKCLSPLIYGLRNQTVRSGLVVNLCFRMNLSVITGKSEISA